jgi:riboflavin synthase
MFTGIIETTGKIVSVEKEKNNLHFTVQSAISSGLKIDQSVAHDGVCLTVTSTDPAKNLHRVTAIRETLEKTSLASWKPEHIINLERCMPVNGRLDGHIVQGHADQTGLCIEKEDKGGSWLFTFQHEEKGNITVEKGSICVNGVSLTVINSQKDRFSVAVIPYTLEHTGFKSLQKGDEVNLEFDIIGKYIARLMEKYT